MPPQFCLFLRCDNLDKTAPGQKRSYDTIARSDLVGARGGDFSGEN
jgi:hypothetical protein